MRLGTWNCRGAFDRKAAAALADLVPDVLVVPECHASPAVASDGWQYRYRHVATKGIGVLVREGWGIEEVDPPGGLDRRWVLPLRIHPPDGECPSFLLLAVWTVAEKGGLSYAAQFADVLETWAPSIRTEATVIAGDLNTSAQGPSSSDHRRNVERAEQLGLESSYHRFHGVDLGDEADMTLRWIGPGGRERRYHCDLVFVPQRWAPAVRSVEAGAWDTWVLSKRSDHAPVVVDVDESAVAAGP